MAGDCQCSDDTVGWMTGDLVIISLVVTVGWMSGELVIFKVLKFIILHFLLSVASCLLVPTTVFT
jgi:hypothetical protein